MLADGRFPSLFTVSVRRAATDAVERMEQVNSAPKTVSQCFKRSIRPAPVPSPRWTPRRRRGRSTTLRRDAGKHEWRRLCENIFGNSIASNGSRGALKSPLEVMPAGSIIRQDGVRSRRRCSVVEQRICQTGPRVQPS